MSDFRKLNIPDVEIITLNRFDAKVRQFLSETVKRSQTSNIQHCLDLNVPMSLTINDDVGIICKIDPIILGVYGYYTNPDYVAPEATPEAPDVTPEATPDAPDVTPEAPEPTPEATPEAPDVTPDVTTESEIKGPVIYDWTWTWAFPRGESVFNPDGCPELESVRTDSTNPTWQSLTSKNVIFSDDPMLISYIQATLVEKLNLETVYATEINSPDGANLFIAIGVKSIEWVEPLEIIPVMEPADDVEGDNI